ncbi:MAG: IMP cyclohydrolase [Candidatus Aminicenantes bacterium]|nr:IMP cyclohydrolase [Candidatus Aminicenantes bacterium]
MTKGLEKLIEKDYPGRLIIVGADRTGKSIIVLYAITGRSPSSQARKIEHSGNKFLVKPTDESILKTGNVDLLIYSAILLSEGIVVSNGKQTDDIQAASRDAGDAAHILKMSLEKWEYEPDAPTFTPRISASILPSKSAAFSIIKRTDDGTAQRKYFEIPLLPGQGKMISTYTGENRDPLPSFGNDPEDVSLSCSSAEDMAEAVYEALKPGGERCEDFRVAVVCVYCDIIDFSHYAFSIINRNERDK